VLDEEASGEQDADGGSGADGDEGAAPGEARAALAGEIGREQIGRTHGD
jgi:hypothetical protein